MERMKARMKRMGFGQGDVSLILHILASILSILFQLSLMTHQLG